MARSLDRIRDGAEHGVAQVFTAAEILRILDRIEYLERGVDRAVEVVQAIEAELNSEQVRAVRGWRQNVRCKLDGARAVLAALYETATKENGSCS
jgi:hypothetical protein